MSSRAALNTFFAYLALRVPEMLATCQQIAAIPVKRTPPPATHYLEAEEMTALLRHLPRQGRHAVRDRTLWLFLYNTAAASARPLMCVSISTTSFEGKSYRLKEAQERAARKAKSRATLKRLPAARKAEASTPSKGTD